MKKISEELFLKDKKFWKILIDNFKPTKQESLDDIVTERWAFPKNWTNLRKTKLKIKVGCGIFMGFFTLGISLQLFFIHGMVVGAIAMGLSLLYAYMFRGWFNKMRKKHVRYEEIK